MKRVLRPERMYELRHRDGLLRRKVRSTQLKVLWAAGLRILNRCVTQWFWLGRFVKARLSVCQDEWQQVRKI